MTATDLSGGRPTRSTTAPSPSSPSVHRPDGFGRPGRRRTLAAVALTEDGHIRKGYFLTGPQALTSREQVEIIAGVSGRPIDFEDTTPHEFARTAIRRGTPPEFADAMENLNELFRAGQAGFVTDDVENITGIAPRTFREGSMARAG
jgi:uncharacterized protein YbjT (DUF2867 family)